MTSPQAHARAVAPETRRVHAARLGMWLFLGSEILLFAGLFAVYAGYRVRDPAMFAAGARETDLVLGALDTGLLLTSSLLVVLGVHARRGGRPVGAALRWGAAIVLGLAFLAAKLLEYAHHLENGLRPVGSPVFWTLYYATTGLHALHVIGGLAILAVLGWRLVFREVPAHVVENGANYWHLVDMVWLFVWPLFYLLRSA